MGQSPADGDEEIVDGEDRNDDEQETSNDDRNPRVKELSDENARKRIENKNLKADLDDARKRLKEFEDAQKTETQRTSDELEATKEQVTQLGERVQSLQIENAFLKNSQYSWKNPATALRLLDLKDVKIDDDGTMHGLDDAIKSLADAEPYLLNKNGEDDSSEDDDEDNSMPTGQRTRTKKQTGPTREDLARKFPALRR